MLEDVVAWTSSATPGAHLVDTIRILNYLPSWLATWKKHGAAQHQKEVALYTRLLDVVRQKTANGESPECLGRCTYLFTLS